jgi:hypothetical protein
MLDNLTDEQRAGAGVYAIRCKADSRLYVGAGKHLGQAFTRARWELRRGRHGSRQLQAMATAHGLAALSFELLASCPVEELARTKQHYLDTHRATDPAHGLNIVLTAGLLAGQPLSAEHRARISAGKQGRPIRPRTAEHQEKLAAAHRGRTRSPETRAAISAATRGKPKRKRST